MTSGVNQNRFPAHLETLAKELNIEFKTEELSEAQDLCFTGVWDTFLQKKWDLINSQKDALTKLVNSLGDNLLFYSIKHDESEIFTKLLDKEICVSSKDKEGNLPIHIAAKLGLLTFVQKLFEHNLTDEKNLKLQTPLHLAASSGHETIVRKLLQMLQKSPQVVKYLAKWEHGTSTFELSPLAVAIIGGHVFCVDALLENSDLIVNIKDIGNLLHLAIFFQQDELLERFLTLYFDKFGFQIEFLNDKGQTPLMLAAYIGNVFAIKLLIQKRAYIETVNNKGNRALHWAVLGEQKNAITLLVSKHAKLDGENEERLTPTLLAKKMGSSLHNYLVNIQNAGGLQNQLQPLNSPPLVGVCQGGGMKGLAHAGMIKYLEECGLISSLKTVAVTSAGALIAGFVATDHCSAEIIHIMKKIDFLKFLDFPGTGLWDAIKQHPIKSTFKLMKKITLITLNPRPSLKILADCVQALWNTTGVCEGEYARNLIENLLKEKTGISYFTFGELRKAIQSGKPYKHLHVFASKLGPNKEILDINSEDSQWDSVIVSDAMRASMGFPGVFKPHRLHIMVVDSAGERIRRPHAENYSLSDGGMLFNLALERFDRKKYFTDNYSEEDKDSPLFNSKVLGLSLIAPGENIRQADREPNNLPELLWNFISIYSQAETLLRNLNPHNKNRIVKANTLDVGTLSFNASEDQKDALVKSGYDCLQKDGRFSHQVTAKIKVNGQTNPPQQVVMTYTLAATDLDTGLFAMNICKNIACAKLNRDQWIQISFKDNSNQTNLEELGPQPCACNTAFEKIIKIAISNMATKLIYGDSKGRHEKILPASKGKAHTLSWNEMPRYMHFVKS